MSNKKNAVPPTTQQHPLIQQQEHEDPNLIRSGGGSTGIPFTTIQEEEAETEEQVHHHETPMVIATLVTLDENPNPTTTTTTINASAIQGTQFDTLDNPEMVMEHRMINTEEESYEVQQDRLNQKNRCLLHGCICSYIALDFNCHTMGYSRTNTCCCVRHNFCCALYHQHYGLGISIMNRYTPYYYNSNSTNDEEASSTPSFLNVACICCEWGIVKPTTLCTNTEQVLCFQTVGSIPFHRDYVPHPILAYYGLSCCPTCDCCVPPPPCPNLSKRQRQHQPLNLTIFRNHHHHPHDDMAYHILSPSSTNNEHPMYRD